MDTHRKNLILIFIALVCAILLFTMPANHKENLSNRRVIALVNGQEIYADNSRKTTNIVDIMNSHQFTSEELNKAVKQYETTAFISSIRQTIIKQNISKLGLFVSDADVQSKVEEMFNALDSNSINEIIKVGNATYDALLAWQKSPSESDTIYNEKLSPLNVSKTNWELMQAIYDTPEALEKMQVPKTIEDMKKYSCQSAENDLLYQKLIDKVTKVTVTEDEIKKAYNIKYADWNYESIYDKVKDKIREHLMKENQSFAFSEWLNEQYKTAKIELKDQKYKDVINMLRAGSQK